MARVRTLEQAAAWVDQVGLALLFPKADVVLPSLWEQVNGSPEENWATRDADGTFVGWTKEMGFLWGAKDDLPARGLVCVGKHAARVVACVSPRIVPTLLAAVDATEPAGLEAEIVDAVCSDGPLTGAQLRGLLGAEKKEVDKSVAALHRRLLLTSSHLVEDGGAWGAIAHDLVARKWPLPRRLPAQAEARRDLAGVVLDSAGELTAADLGGALGWRRKAAAAVLDEIAESREENGFRVWVRP
jgi:Winged helix DNA-binding domain